MTLESINAMMDDKGHFYFCCEQNNCKRLQIGLAVDKWKYIYYNMDAKGVCVVDKA